MSYILIMKKFCRDGDERELLKLSRAGAVIFQRLSVVTLQRPGGNYDIARRVLSYYGLDDKGHRIFAKKPPGKTSGLSFNKSSGGIYAKKQK